MGRSDDVLWELSETGGDIVRYSDTDFVVDDIQPWFGHSTLAMKSDAEDMWDLSAALYEAEGYKNYCHHWESYYGISLYGGVDAYSLRPYTGNIIWNDIEEVVGIALPNTGGAGISPVIMVCGAVLLALAGGMTVLRRRKHYEAEFDNTYTL